MAAVEGAGQSLLMSSGVGKLDREGFLSDSSRCNPSVVIASEDCGIRDLGCLVLGEMWEMVVKSLGK